MTTESSFPLTRLAWRRFVRSWRSYVRARRSYRAAVLVRKLANHLDDAPADVALLRALYDWCAAPAKDHDFSNIDQIT